MSLMRWRARPLLSRPMMRVHDLVDEFDRLIAMPSELSDEAEYGPAVDVYETDSEVVVKAQLPGVKKEDLDVNIQENTITIRAETRREEEVKDEGYFRRELHYGSWARRLPLPTPVDEEAVSATLNNGVLEVHAKKSAKVEEGGKKIEVK